MKLEKIEAYKIEGKDENGKPIKKLCGSTQWERPETVEEIMDNFEDEEIVASFVYGYVVREQARLRAPENSKKNPFVQAFAKLSKEQQEALLAALQRTNP